METSTPSAFRSDCLRSWVWTAFCCVALSSMLPGLARAATVPAAPPGDTLSAAAPPVQVAVKALTTTAWSGLPVQVQVLVSGDPGVQLSGPDYDLTLGDWVVLGVKREPLPGANHPAFTDYLNLMTYLDGSVEIPALVVRFKTPAGQIGEFRSAAQSVTVRMPEKLARQLLPVDLKSPIGFFPWNLLLLLAAVALAVAAGIYYYHRRTRSNEPPKPKEPPKPPEVTARERLAALRAATYLQLGDYKAYYIELSDILRTYVQDRYRLPALDRTTAELLRELKATAIQRSDAAAVREVLEMSDMVKFAKARPAEGETQKDWQSVSDLVERTTPTPDPSAAAPMPMPQAESDAPERGGEK